MAKKTARRVRTATDQALAALSAKVRKAIDSIRRPFEAFAEDFRLITESRKELAPRFMKAFGMWQQETGGAFVEFCRLLAPDIPVQSRTTPDGAGYRDHPTYQAAEYLRRLAAAEARAELTPAQRAERIQNAAAPPMLAMAKLIKAILPLIQAEQSNTIFEALRSQLHWTDRTVQRIQTETQRVEPLVTLREPRGLHALGTLRMVVPATPAEGEELRTGTQG